VETVTDVRLNLTCFKGLDGKSAYKLYHDMRMWFLFREIPYRFDWNDTGKYIPDYLTLNKESAIAFKLVFNV